MYIFIHVLQSELSSYGAVMNILKVVMPGEIQRTVCVLTWRFYRGLLHAWWGFSDLTLPENEKMNLSPKRLISGLFSSSAVAL